MKKIFFSLSALAAAGILTQSACTFKNEEETYGAGCDTTNVTLSATIRPILEQRCYACHSVANANTLGAGLDFQTYSSIKQFLDGSADVFISAIRQEEVNGITASSMPKAEPRISTCEILKLEKWIANGYPDN